VKKHEWFFVFIPLVFTLLVDQVTKAWADSLEGIISWGIFGFVLHHNPGAMLGLFSDLPPVLRVVTLSTGGAFLVCIYAIIQYLLPIKSLKLRIGLSILLGGILGNVLDRILYGYVIDFIVVGNVSFSSPAFNMADALQWVGYGLIVWAIISEGELLWPENDARKRYWINLGFQLKYCFFLFSVGLGIGLIALVFSFTYLRVTMIELVGHNDFVLDKFLYPFAITFSLLTLGFSVGLFAIGKLISHKIAGPLYAFEKFMNDTMSGINRPFKLRTKDEFKHLETLGKKIQEHLVKNKALPPTIHSKEISAEEQELQGAIEVEAIEKQTGKKT
jgi:signal peptidase II